MEEAAYLLAALIGAAVGLAELVSRYRDAPRQALKSPAASLYLVINAGASTFALHMILANGWTFTFADSGALLTWQVMIAGFGALTLFRSSLFTVHIGGSDVQVGPAAFLQIILGAVDRAVDRTRAEQRALRVAQIMKGVVFEKAWLDLSQHCIALMQNMGAEETVELGRAVRELKNTDTNDEIKTLQLGLILMAAVGEDVLSAAVSTLGDQLRDAPASKSRS